MRLRNQCYQSDFNILVFLSRSWLVYEIQISLKNGLSNFYVSLLVLCAGKEPRRRAKEFPDTPPSLLLLRVHISILDKGSLSVVGTGEKKGNKAKEGLTAILLSP